MLKLTTCNDIGLKITEEDNTRIPDIHFYEENGTVRFWITVRPSPGEQNECDALQNLTASEAMQFAKAMETCAIQALKNQSI